MVFAPPSPLRVVELPPLHSIFQVAAPVVLRPRELATADPSSVISTMRAELTPGRT